MLADESLFPPPRERKEDSLEVGRFPFQFVGENRGRNSAGERVIRERFLAVRGEKKNGSNGRACRGGGKSVW